MLRVQEICKEKGITLQQLAKRMDISYQALYSNLSGNPTLSKLESISSVLGVPITDLFEREPENTIICPKCGTHLEVSIKDQKKEE